MGQIASTNQNHTKPSKTIKRYAHGIRIRTPVGSFDYNEMPLAPTGCEYKYMKKQTNAALGRTIWWTDGI
jgi:hypothetical protein